MISSAAGTPSRAGGNTAGGATSPISARISGQAPVTTRPSTNQRTTPTAIAKTMSRPTFARPRANATTRTTSAHSAGRSPKICHMPSIAVGRAVKKLVIARENPGSGTAMSPTNTMPTNEIVSSTTSVARRARGWSPELLKSRSPRRMRLAIAVTASAASRPDPDPFGPVMDSLETTALQERMIGDQEPDSSPARHDDHVKEPRRDVCRGDGDEVP